MVSGIDIYHFFQSNKFLYFCFVLPKIQKDLRSLQVITNGLCEFFYNTVHTFFIVFVYTFWHRNREWHLSRLLKHLHPILKSQQLHYRIFVVEQVGYEPVVK